LCKLPLKPNCLKVEKYFLFARFVRESFLKQAFAIAKSGLPYDEEFVSVLAR